jgi:hypothetical protein
VPAYYVEYATEGREVYLIEADNESQASQRGAEHGDLVISEVLSVDHDDPIVTEVPQ